MSFMPSVTHAECRTEAHYVECHYVECHYAECCYAECCYAECRAALLASLKPSVDQGYW